MSADLAFERLAERALDRASWLRAYQELAATAAELGWALPDPAQAEWWTPDHILVALEVRKDAIHCEPVPEATLWYEGLITSASGPYSTYPARVFRRTLDASLDTLRRLSEDLGL